MSVFAAFRPHHFLCALCFQGKGYSAEFVANFSAIMGQLNAENGDDCLLQVVAETDAICSPCPHKREHSCTSQAKIAVLDKAHAEILGLKTGDILTWGKAKQLIAAYMTVEKFNTACAPCQWKQLGICEGVLRDVVRPISS